MTQKELTCEYYKQPDALQNKFRIIQDSPYMQYTKEVLLGSVKNFVQLFQGKKMGNDQQKMTFLEEMQVQALGRSSNSQISVNQFEIIHELMAKNSQQIANYLSSEEKDQFLQIIGDIQESYQMHKELKSQFSQISSQVEEIINFIISNFASDKKSNLNVSKQIKWIVLLFKFFQEKYQTNTVRRKFLHQFCENTGVDKQKSNPFGIIRFMEDSITEQTPIISALRKLPLSVSYAQLKKNEIPIESIEFEREKAHAPIDNEIIRIGQQIISNKNKIPTIQFEKLTSGKHKVITFLISGFLSQNSCKVNEWQGISKRIPDSQVYTIRWESKTTSDLVKELLKNLGSSIKDSIVCSPKAIPLMILNVVYQVVKSSRDQNSTFLKAFSEAALAGQYLAEFFMNNFEGHYINLVGFSLGTEVISNIMETMEKKNKLNMLNKIYLMGGVADMNKINGMVSSSPCPLTIVNLHTERDYILKCILSICKSNLKPIGLNPLKESSGHKIINIDCKGLSNGHLQYRENLEFYCSILKMQND